MANQVQQAALTLLSRGIGSQRTHHASLPVALPRGSKHEMVVHRAAPRATCNVDMSRITATTTGRASPSSCLIAPADGAGWREQSERQNWPLGSAPQHDPSHRAAGGAVDAG